jgi:restriction endonuclease S subunit
LEGLEVSEINLQEVLLDNENWRIDSEYFKKQFLNFFKNVPNLKPLEYFVKDGYRVVYENTQIIDKEEGTANNYSYFLQATDLDTPFIKTDNLFYVKEEDWKRYPKGRISSGELLIEVKGKVEKVAIVPNDFPEKTLVSGSLFKLTVNENMSKHVLLCYLTSKYGTAFKDRYKTNLLISYISKPDLYRIPVPQFSKEFQKQIDNKFEIIFDAKKQSQALYHQAEELLLETIGLKNFQPTQENKNIKSFSESFLATGRLDAEYYQPKYEEIISKIKQQGYDLLGNLVSIKKSIEPGSDVYSDDGLPFLRVADCNKFGISTPEKKLSDTFCKENLILIENLKPRKETILFSKDGTVGTAYMLREDADLITSGAILHLTVKNSKVLPEYLTLALNSEAVQQQAERDAGGSIILHWRMEEIENVVVPVVDINIQQQIAELVEKSFYLCAESKRLLNESKGMVEKEIDNKIE